MNDTSIGRHIDNDVCSNCGFPWEEHDMVGVMVRPDGPDGPAEWDEYPDCGPLADTFLAHRWRVSQAWAAFVLAFAESVRIPQLLTRVEKWMKKNKNL